MQNRYKFINFTHVGGQQWICRNNRSRDILGYVQWSKEWKCFVFAPEDNTEFSANCMQDICHFIGQLVGPDTVKRGPWTAPTKSVKEDANV